MAQKGKGYGTAANAGHDHSHNVQPVRNMRASSQRLPVLILTGYLGAGKTTLLNYILHEQRDKKLAVIENEIGEVSVDDALVEQKHEDLAAELIVLDNGCVCCTIRGDLENTLKDLGKKCMNGLVLDGVLIELTGAADPAPVVQTFFMSKEVQQSFYVDNVITLVDAKHAVQKLDASKANPGNKGTAAAQIAFSSCVLLNKTDLVDEEVLQQTEKRIKEVNSVVNIIRCQQARVPVSCLFNVKVFDLERVLEEQYMDAEEFNTFYQPKMDTGITNVGIRIEGTLNLFAFQQFLSKYLDSEESATDFMRVKGVLSICGSPKKFVLQCVHMLKNQNFTHPWKQGEKRECRIIFIGSGMERRRKELTDGFMACLISPPRFPIGTKVKARTGEGDADGYELGTVIALWDEYNAYRVRLQSGDEVHAPIDKDSYVKAA